MLRFPPGKGDPKWQTPTDRLFLGIDHTAIVVSNTEKSLKFYRDVLGLRVVGASQNSGPEQEHLNNVSGARLRITSLRASTGPGIEFLEYLSPRNGRPRPADTHANDLWYWQTRLTTSEAAEAVKRLHARKSPFVSPHIITLPNATLGFTQGIPTRDPDGLVMQLIER